MGAYPPPAGFQDQGIRRQTNTMALVSLIAAISSYVLFPCIGSIVGLICGIMAKKQIDQEPERWEGRGMATAGIVISCIHLGVSVLAVLAYVVFVVLFTAGAALGS